MATEVMEARVDLTATEVMEARVDLTVMEKMVVIHRHHLTDSTETEMIVMVTTMTTTDLAAEILLICRMAEAKIKAKAKMETDSRVEAISQDSEDRVQVEMPDLTGSSRATENQEQAPALHLQELGYYLVQALQHSLQVYA